MSGIPLSQDEKERRTREILLAAEAVWLKLGLSHGTIDMVSARAGLAKGTLYLYWESREKLMAAVRDKVIAALQITDGDEMAPGLVLLAELELALNREQLVQGVRRPGVAQHLYVALTDAR